MIVLLVIRFVICCNIIVSGISNCPNKQIINESLEKVHIPGAVIIVVNATHTLYEQAFGYQSLVSKQPMDIDKSIFSLGSISKTFIATAAMHLVEQNLIDLDADVNKYLKEPQRLIFHPDYPTYAITLRRLLSHSAATYLSLPEQYPQYKLGDEGFSESLADVCFKYVNPNTSNWLSKPPGAVTSYSNIGAALAALVVERVANMSYIDYVEEKILKPLGIDITKTGVRLSDFGNVEDIVKHYAYASNKTHVDQWNSIMPQLNISPMEDHFPTWLSIPHFSFSPYPSGLLRVSGRTLSTFLQMFLRNGSNILHPRSIAEIRTVVGCGLISPSDQQSTQRFGLSWYWETMSDGRRYFGHGGSLPGIVNLMLINEKNNLGVIVLSNGDIIAPNDLSKATLATVQDLHMSLFDCFESNSMHSFSFDSKRSDFLFTIFILVFFQFSVI
ncbi:unnamed protein product [Adineta ricciae]|uniref:Beta-lactamase-related domain-containing protein n=1 Tax=Adineta ricciae TaxID=249248 RepID=A0A814FY09_ADIRI|nr:unnamed protein product [Adineta ricciae]